MADNVDLGIAAEHRGAHVIRLLRQAHAVNLAPGAGNLGGHPPAARRVRENPVGAAAVLGCAEFLHELRDLVDRVLLRREIVGHALRLGVTEVRRRKIVPHAARRFLAGVFSLDDGQRRDLASAFGAFADVHELCVNLVCPPVGVGAAAMWIVFVRESAQLGGVLAGDLLVAALPNKDRGVVAEVNHQVAKRHRAELPRGLHRVGLSVGARLQRDEAKPIAGGDLRGPAGAVTPANEIAARLFHQVERVKVQPIRLGHAKAGPLVGRLLAPAVEFHMAAVDEETLRDIPLHRANAERHFGAVHRFPGDAQ